MRKILVVDDEPKLLNMVSDYLKSEGYKVVQAHLGKAALDEALSPRADIDLIVLDLMLPDMSGLDVCRAIRNKSNVPIIMLTAKAEEVDKLIGLEMGADDYITKPFSLRELGARIRAVLRRTEGSGARQTPSETVTVGDLVVDNAKHQVYVAGQPVSLTPTEFKILSILASYPGRVYSRLQLVDAVLGESYEGYERSIDTHVSNIRRKIEKDPGEPKYIKTVYGVGYKLEDPEASETGPGRS